MNCKPGDLAVIVRSKYGHAGKLVLVTVADRGGQPLTWEVEPLWNIPLKFRKEYFRCRDKNLRPIRDNDGPDETLAWAGKPNEVTA